MQQDQSTNKKLQLTFNIRQIQVINFMIDNSPEHQMLKADHGYTFEIHAAGLVDPENKLVGINFGTSVFTSEAKNDKVCELVIRVTFHILNFEEIAKKSDNSYLIPDPFMHHLIALTLATARGILFEKVQGTFLANLVLPIIDVTKLKKRDVEEK
ncbi:MAG: hypothetical protein GYA14_10600 [Ignavibacteria bacterium]|nr:hypothetical protein [Ignavibacteria bacterium]